MEFTYRYLRRGCVRKRPQRLSRNSPIIRPDGVGKAASWPGFDADCVEWHNEVWFFSVLCQLKQGTGIVSKTFSFQGNWSSPQLSEHKHERYVCVHHRKKRLAIPHKTPAWTAVFRGCYSNHGKTVKLFLVEELFLFTYLVNWFINLLSHTLY